MQEFYLSAIKAEIQKPDEQQLELPAGHGESILVADYEVEIRETTRAILEAYVQRVHSQEWGGCRIVIPQNREEIEIVLMDLMMPVMDGSASIRLLHKN